MTGWSSSSAEWRKTFPPARGPGAGSGIHPEGANPCGCCSCVESWLSSVVEGDLEISWVARKDRDGLGRSSRHHHQSAQQGNSDQDGIFRASHDSSSRLKRASSGHSTKAPTNGDSLVKSILRILGQTRPYTPDRGPCTKDRRREMPAIGPASPRLIPTGCAFREPTLRQWEGRWHLRRGRTRCRRPGCCYCAGRTWHSTVGTLQECRCRPRRPSHRRRTGHPDSRRRTGRRRLLVVLV